MDTFLEDINNWTPDLNADLYELNELNISNLQHIFSFLKASGIDIHVFNNQYFYLYFYSIEESIHQTVKIIKCHTKFRKRLLDELNTLQIKYKIFL